MKLCFGVCIISFFTSKLSSHPHILKTSLETMAMANGVASPLACLDNKVCTPLLGCSVNQASEYSLARVTQDWDS
jgi:hypothetical protein